MKDDFMNYKLVSVTPPAAIVDNAALTTAYVDTAGFDHARFILHLGAMDIAMTELKLTECDTSGGSYTDVTGAVFGTSTDIDGSASTLPSATDDNKFFTIDVDLRGRKRYLDLSATCGDGSTGTYAEISCMLFRRDTMPITKTARGVGGALQV